MKNSLEVKRIRNELNSLRKRHTKRSYKSHKLEYHVVIRYFRITEIVYHNALINPIYDTVIAAVYIATLRHYHDEEDNFFRILSPITRRVSTRSIDMTCFLGSSKI